MEAASLPDYDVAAWIGYAVPSATPRDIVVRLSGEIQKALQNPELKERLLNAGLDPVSSTPESVAAVEACLQDVLVTFGIETFPPLCVLSLCPLSFLFFIL